MNVPGVPPHRKVDAPSDADFFKAIYDNTPGKKQERETVLGLAAVYLARKALKKRGNKKS